ncbi:hypothetical protein PROFUN_14507 [Planoprotostelium fungivorum]|uniref:Uncharacterized protein n=1 Tax=Planoprotostelium fungivorum TaxID=1890364 RepID=A0A2P6MZQ3_9EUKA|nr:hypothetical protein PROFUN_14507 [Planoprotostelium fungivorum]
MRKPGFEPGYPAWEADMLTTASYALVKDLIIEMANLPHE